MRSGRTDGCKRRHLRLRMVLALLFSAIAVACAPLASPGGALAADNVTSALASPGGALAVDNVASADNDMSADNVASADDEVLISTESSDVWHRLAGATALDTMQHIVGIGDASSYGNAFANGRGGTVIVVTEDGYWDALTASGLAGMCDAPVLMTTSSTLSAQTKAELTRLAPTQVIICGGDAAVSESVSSDIHSLTGVVPVRYSDQRATGTARRVYEAERARGTCAKTAFVVTVNGYWDALSVASYAYANHCPLFLTEADGQLSSETIADLASGGFDDVYLVGGPAVVSEAVISQLKDAQVNFGGRLYGENACQTSEAFAEWALDADRGSDRLMVEKMGVATNDGYWDALTGAALCGHNRAVLVLASDADRTTVDGVIAQNRSAISTGYIFGGTAAISVTLADWICGLTPVASHGALSVKGTQVVDQNGAAFQIKGVSTHGLAWFPQYANQAAFRTWRQWGANTVRLALYTEEYGGWCNTDDTGRAALLNTLCNGVDAATAEGMYAIVDWHILSDGDPNVNLAQAKSFFGTVSKNYANRDNVIYEICNEPNGGTSWDRIRAYASVIIPIIRANDPDALIIVGTPTWSQDVDAAAAAPLSYDNVVYALHFYAATHGSSLRAKAQTALDKGLPLIVSEFGACEASGDGNVNTSSADAWIGFLTNRGIGYVCWNLSNKNEASSLVGNSCSKLSGWSASDLSAEGRWYRQVLLGLRGTSGGTVDDGSGSSGGTGSSGTGSGGTTGSGSATNTVDATSSGLAVSCGRSNAWSSGSDHFAQFNLAAKNGGDAAVSSWRAKLTFSGDVSLDQIWNATATVDGRTMTVTPASYAQQIAVGGTASGIGFIVKGAQAPTVTAVEIVR